MPKIIDVNTEFGSASGYVVDASKPQIANYLSEFTEHANCFAQVLNARGGCVGLLKNIVVSDDHRGQGAGTELLEAFLEAAANECAGDLILVSDLGEAQADGFDLCEWYERYDFERVTMVSGGVLMASGAGLADELRNAVHTDLAFNIMNSEPTCPRTLISLLQRSRPISSRSQRITALSTWRGQSVSHWSLEKRIRACGWSSLWTMSPEERASKERDGR